MGRGTLEHVLEEIAERVSRTSAWEGIRRADLLGGPVAPDRPGVSRVEEGFSDDWGRMALRSDPDSDDDTEYPGFGGAV